MLHLAILNTLYVDTFRFGQRAINVLFQSAELLLFARTFQREFVLRHQPLCDVISVTVLVAPGAGLEDAVSELWVI